MGHIRMAVENAPEHPIAVRIRSSPLRDLHHLLRMIILNGIIARQLNEVVTSNALTPVHRERLLRLPQPLRGLLRRQHLDNPLPVVVPARQLGYRPLAHDGPLPQLVRAHDKDRPGSSRIRRRGRGAEPPRGDRLGRHAAAVRVPDAVPCDEARHERNGDAAEVHGRLQRLFWGERAAIRRAGEAAAGGAGEAADGGEVGRPEGPDGCSMHRVAGRVEAELLRGPAGNLEKERLVGQPRRGRALLWLDDVVKLEVRVAGRQKRQGWAAGELT